MPRALAVLSLLVAVSACAQPADPVAASSATAEPVATVETEAGTLGVYPVVTGLDHPWGIAFLPDGRALVTERAGRLHLVANGATRVVPGTPEVAAGGQGGLLDVALSPDFGESGLVYLTYSKPGPGGSATAVGRGRLADGALVGFEEIWAQAPSHGTNRHFGSRIAFAPDGMLLVSTGDRGQKDPAQDLGDTVGVIVRLTPDGAVPDDNPFVGQAGARPEIWSYGHRNAQSLGVDPATGEIWEAEFGPRGGDELNRIERGANYGWPLVSSGENYNRTPIPDPSTRPDLTAAVRDWSPVISPSGMLFYTADAIPEWTGSLMLGSLGREGVVRLEIDGGAVTHEETIELGERIRDVEQGPDGAVYVLVDEADGAVWRLAPIPN
ncbi:PQQ-dependent sugar dehydrogenase [Rubrivirga sp. IMCC45206]|uniref:PQQ-dependent sugar dehydrogenase n=1 Tax=Rubrivirga sp. IMCC45206 TaxID=3391614 RepID=UPI00398F90C3